MQSRMIYFIAYMAGFLMPYITGFLGLMPLDQSVIFEAAGRIAGGQVPFSDFYLPYGLVPAFMQSVFFKLMGIGWFAYVTQAAVINGFFALLVFDCLRMLIGFARPGALLAGSLLCAWSFYPVTGTPFLENHSFFFSFAAYWCCLAAFSRKNYFLLLFSFPLLVPGFYSKPIPAVLWILPILLECWWNRKDLRSYFIYFASGSLIAVLLLVVPFWLFPSHDFYYNAILLPFKLGKGRLQVGFAGRFVAQFKYFKIFFFSLIPMVLSLFHVGSTDEKTRHFLRMSLWISLAILFGVLTKGNFYNITSPVFVFCAVVFHFLLSQSGSQVKLVAIYRRFNLVFWLVLLGSISMLNFRRTKDIAFAIEDLSNYSSQLSVFVKTPLNWYSKSDLEKLKTKISGGNVLYTGDLQFLFSLTGQYNPLPLTHINDGTTYSSRDVEGYARLKNQLLDNLLASQTRYFIEDESIYNPDQHLVAYLQPLKSDLVDTFGPIKVYRINDAALRQLASNLKSNREK